MVIRFDLLATLTLFLYSVLLLPADFGDADAATCQYGALDGNKLYNYSLVSPLLHFPHGVRSEDGFYKVAANDTILWFQLCDEMIFNHDPPRCVDCLDCGGESRCGVGCSAIVANNVGGYLVCSTIGGSSSFNIDLVDEKKPHMGVIVKLTSNRTLLNCSLSVSVLCNHDGIRGPESLNSSGTCDYETVMWHPSGCATVVSMRGKGWGWFGILFIMFLCVLGFYLLVGVLYRFFFLKIRGLDSPFDKLNHNAECTFRLKDKLLIRAVTYSLVIPNLEFWTNIPHRTQSWLTSSFHKVRGPTHRERSSYSSVNF